jgi:hypothetical protein
MIATRPNPKPSSKFKPQQLDLEMNIANAKNVEMERRNKEASSVTEDLSSQGPAIPSPCPPATSQIRVSESAYVERLAAEYLGPKNRSRSQDWAYDDRILSGSRLRDMNIARIQHDILKLQHKLTSSGEGNRAHLELLSVLLHDQGNPVKTKLARQANLL